MKKEHVFSVILILGLWHIAAVSVHNDILIPYPLETLSRTLELFRKPEFYGAVGSTLFRVAKGFFLSFAAALVISILAERFPRFQMCVSPLLVITRTIPNISYIVIALIWLGAEGAVSAVSFMILFPVFANAFSNRLAGTDETLREVEQIYPETFFFRLKYRVLPDLVPEMLATGKTAAGLGLKVGIMAEILGQVRSGIGRSMNYARLNLDTAGIVAWTIVIILLSVGIDLLFSWLQAQRMKEEL
jgi:NitT/TauT family transport system permease protein